MVARALRRRLFDVAYPAKLGSDEFETCLVKVEIGSNSQGALRFDHGAIAFAPLEVIIAMLCLYNRLAVGGAEVELLWSDTNATFGYAERIGFFSALDSRVSVLPRRPVDGASSFDAYNSRNPSILELQPIDLKSSRHTKQVVADLEGRLRRLLHECNGLETAVNRIWTCATECIQNITEHSATPVPGVVAAQRYRSKDRGDRVQLVIADVGLGMLDTIRRGKRALAAKADKDLILRAFRRGLSSKPELGRGCGLTQCAELVAKYGGNLRVRTGRTWAKLVTKSRRGWTVGIYDDAASFIAGTQLSFDFYLDRLSASANLVH